MDFSLSDKHSKEVEARRREAKRKLEEQRRDQKLQAAMETELKEREEQRLRELEQERQQAEAEARLNDGVRFRHRYRPVPVNRTDDRLTLPPSALEALEQQRALDGGVLTFAVVLPNGTLTHAGVAEFTAEEGTVGVPPRVALCLTKGAGLATLAAVEMVEVRFVRLPRAAKCTARLQPRGEGFHAGGIVAVRMDLQHILHESLRGHIALTEGDWLPIRHNGVTYELVVRDLTPEPKLALLDTELEVDIMPSEQTEAEIRAEEEARAEAERARQAEEEKEQERLRRAARKAASLPEEPAAGPDVVQILLRLPDGQRLQRRFAKSTLLGVVLDWVESEPSSHVTTEQFCLVQKWPGHCREIGSSESSKTLSEIGFARQEALFLQHLATEEQTSEPEVESAQVDNNGPAGTQSQDAQPIRLASRKQLQGGAAAPTVAVDAWTEAEQRAHEMLDQRLEGKVSPSHHVSEDPELEEVRGQELVDVFERLVAMGMKPQDAAAASKRFAPQLKELGEMGFGDWPRAVQLLDKYHGRLLRVANLLAEDQMTDEPTPMDVSPPSPPVPTPAPAQQEQTARKAMPPGLEAKFKELVAAGMKPAEAATTALRLLKEQASAPPPTETTPAVEPPAVTADGFSSQMAELVAMGFTDADRNAVLLRKYAGRMERVVNALCEPA
mmetsp:Transcript_52807/g.97733  ORF Transcript_52807/g.97733 Transcript_52807/m.97733 type:complete len:670 (+) Transcript_52807:112-2121(+)